MGPQPLTRELALRRLDGGRFPEDARALAWSWVDNLVRVRARVRVRHACTRLRDARLVRVGCWLGACEGWLLARYSATKQGSGRVRKGGTCTRLGTSRRTGRPARTPRAAPGVRVRARVRARVRVMARVRARDSG